MDNFFQQYLEYANVDKSESPIAFHRWSIISTISAILGRNCYVPFGHSKIYPNQYIMIMGSPGTRKSSAINIAIKLAKKAGYTRFSSDRTSKERFLIDMAQLDDVTDTEELLDITGDEPSEMYVAIGEFTDFIGQNNMEFVTMLTNLWDNPAVYKNPKIHGKSVEVNKPTVNILGGNTAQGFALAFPPESLGNGFLSRLIFVHGETTGKKITFPPKPNMELEAKLIHVLEQIQEICKDEISISPEAEMLFDRIYNNEIEVDDYRFKHYTTRRLTHLIKISMVICCTKLKTTIEPEDVLEANTVLANTERKMPQALGEFGKGKHADVSNTIMNILHESNSPLNSTDLYKKVSNDISKLTDLHDIMKSLQDAGKVQVATNKAGKTGYLPLLAPTKEWADDLLLPNYLTTEESR